MRDVALPTPGQFASAWDVVRQHLPITPVVAAPQLGQGLSLKVETFQPTGSFKVRGGLAAVAATLASDPARAVVGSSAGNHGLGLAYAAAQLKANVTVVVPERASAAKVSALQQFDVNLVHHGDGYSQAEALALEIAERDGSRFVSPYNDPDVIAGQGTIARELLDQVPNLGTVVVPVGGGGLISGLTLGLANSGVTVIGVESVASPSASSAIAAGGIVPVTVTATLADGLSGNLEEGAVTIDVLLQHHVEVITVTEADIRSAMEYAVQHLGLVLEGAGAVGVAAVRTGRIPPNEDGKETVVLLTGRNIAPALLEEVFSA
jgi:threonine dehydratase